MKRIISLALAVMLMLASAALAAPGDATIYNQNDESMQGVYINSMAYYDGVLYMADWGENIYTWTQESGEIKTWPMPTPNEMMGIDTDEGSASMSRILPGDDGVYLMYEVYETDADEESSLFDHMTLVKPNINGEELTYDGDMWELDWDDLVQEWDDYSYPNGITSAFVADGRLIGMSYTDSGDQVVVVVDIEDDDMELLPAVDCNLVVPYTDEKALTVIRSYESESDPAVIASIDLESGEIEELIQVPTTNWSYPSQLAYDAANDMLYYILNGELYRVTGMDYATVESVAAVNADSWSENLAYVTSDGFYICGDYQSIMIRNTDPSLRSEESITVYTSYNTVMEKAYYDFNGANPDIEVVMATSYEDITQAMMNQSSTVDVYTLYVNNQDFAAIFDRGYMAELDSSTAITEFVNSVYPQFQDVLVRDGHVVAVPVELWSNCYSYNPKAFEKLGLTEADVPTSWQEFLDFAKKLPEIWGENKEGYTLFDPYYTVDDARYMLFYEIVDDYMVYLQRDDVEFAFDTELMRNLLKTLDEIDFAALGFLESYEEEMDYVYNDETILFNTYSDVSSDVWFMNNEFSRPMPLAMVEGDTPVISANMAVAFVNPYSENRELAIAYLESAVNSIDHRLRVNLSPDFNEPLENSYYEENLATMQETIDSWQKQLETTEDEEARAQIEKDIEDYKAYMEEYTLENRYDISEESIAYYRGYAQCLTPVRYIGFDEEANTEFYTQLAQYVSGAIDADTFLKNIDKKLRMMMLEDQ